MQRVFSTPIYAPPPPRKTCLKNNFQSVNDSRQRRHPVPRCAPYPPSLPHEPPAAPAGLMPRLRPPSRCLGPSFDRVCQEPDES